MREKELIIFIILVTVLLLVLLGGIFLFLFQYRKRKQLFEKEKAMIEKQHHLDLLNTQITSQQLTMQYIGREIHDHVGQKLTLASLYCRQIAEAKNAETINILIDESLQELRRLSRSLTDPSQMEKTLFQLLQIEAEQINTGDLCKINIQEEDHFPFLQAGPKHLILRILQEFMQNSLKHAACSKIDIQLLTEGTQICILANDNGKGFNTDDAAAGIGLYNMKRRANELQAFFELKSSPGAGTFLYLKVSQLFYSDMS